MNKKKTELQPERRAVHTISQYLHTFKHIVQEDDDKKNDTKN